MTILALDPARLCGFALGSTERGYICSGTWELTKNPKKGEKVPPDALKLAALVDHLNDARFSTIERVAFETPAFGTFPMALISHAKLLGAIELWAFTRGVSTVGYAPTKIKKWATGSGKAKKPDMQKWARKRFLLDKPDADDNEVDAVCILHLALTEAA